MFDWKQNYYVYDTAMFKNFFLAQFLLLLLLKSVSAAKVEEINISGNERISKDTIIIFGEIDLKDDFNNNKINT